MICSISEPQIRKRFAITQATITCKTVQRDMPWIVQLDELEKMQGFAAQVVELLALDAEVLAAPVAAPCMVVLVAHWTDWESRQSTELVVGLVVLDWPG